MSRLDELIRELCPDGVEYRTLGSLSSLVTKQTGFDYTNHIKSRLLIEQEEGSVPYIQTKFFSGRSFNYNTDYFVPKDVVEKFPKISLDEKCLLFSIVGASIGNVGLFPGNTKCFLGGAICVVKIKKEFNVDYLYYCIESNHVQHQIRRKTKGAGQATITVEDIREFTVPFPPIEVQREIVRILDKFTELSAELAAELSARQRQYSYYRETLLSFKIEVQHKPLGEVCGMKAGKAISSFEISNQATDEASIPCYGGNGIRGYVKAANQQGDKPIIGRQGALCGNVCYATGSYYATEHAVVVTDKGYYISRFLYHLLLHMNLNQYKSAGAQPGLSVSKLETIHVPVPPLSVQRRIVNILDNFDAICSDLQNGLPAEIEARRKQYEYYRDKLLTFKPLA